MNNFISKAFQIVFELIHFVVVIALVLAVLYAPNENRIDVLLASLGLFIVYILIAGTISTLISMNKHLSEIAKAVRNEV